MSGSSASKTNRYSAAVEIVCNEVVDRSSKASLPADGATTGVAVTDSRVHLWLSLVLTLT